MCNISTGIHTLKDIEVVRFSSFILYEITHSAWSHLLSGGKQSKIT